MITGISSGNILPITSSPKQYETEGKTPDSSTDNTTSSEIADVVTTSSLLPESLLRLIDPDLTTEGAHQATALAANSLSGSGYSIANADPARIAGLGT